MSVGYCKKPTSSPLIDEEIFEIGGWLIIKSSYKGVGFKIFAGSAYWTVTVVVPVVVVPVIALLLNRFIFNYQRVNLIIFKYIIIKLVIFNVPRNFC